MIGSVRTRRRRGGSLDDGRVAERLRRLRNRPELLTLARFARLQESRAWIVGGAVRDAVLNLPVKDLDVSVSQGAESLAKALEERKLGRAVLLSRSAPRVFRVAGRREMDLVELEGISIERDLARRDFTANALAVDLLSGDHLDPYGGLGDLRRGRLRLLSDANFREDPLRVFRAARFIATHGLLPDRATRLACRRHAVRLRQVAPERITTELTKILEAPRAAPALAWAAAANLLGPALALPAPAGGWKRFARRLAVLDSPAVRRRPPRRRFILRLSLLAGILRLSSLRAAAWVRAGRYDRKTAGEVPALLDLLASARRTQEDMDFWRWVRDAGSRRRDALALLTLLDPTERHRARRLARRAARARRTPRVKGAQIVRWTGLAPGPRVGILLRELEVEVLRGKVKSPAEARKWLKARGVESKARRL